MMGSIVNAAEKYKLKAHDSKLNAAPLCFVNFSKYFQPIMLAHAFVKIVGI